MNGIHNIGVAQHAQQYNGTRDSEAKAENNAVQKRHPERFRREGAKNGRRCRLDKRPGQGDALDRQQVVHMKMQADTEHEQDNARFRKFHGKVRIRDEPGRLRPDNNARHKIPDNGRKLQSLGDIPEYKGENKTSGQNFKKFVFVHSVPPESSAVRIIRQRCGREKRRTRADSTTGTRSEYRKRDEGKRIFIGSLYQPACRARTFPQR